MKSEVRKAAHSLKVPQPRIVDNEYCIWIEGRFSSSFQYAISIQATEVNIRSISPIQTFTPDHVEMYRIWLEQLNELFHHIYRSFYFWEDNHLKELPNA